MNRLPPNQQLAAPGKWPVVGEKAPHESAAPWILRVGGLVARGGMWTLDELRAMPQVEREIDIHCVTRWSKLGARFGGVPLFDLLEEASIRPEARFLSFVARSERNHSTSLALDDARELDPLVALTCEGEPLEKSHGGPVRLVTPGRYFYKSVKWLERVEARAEDRLGYWEAETGYHNNADPWREERYISRDIEPRLLGELLARRDFSGRDLLGLEAAGMILSGLKADGALLRNADFRGAHLAYAAFRGANLSNARLQGADLTLADFRDADVEGADFRGADLSGANFTGASLFGCTFVGETPDEWGPAKLEFTVIPPDAIEALTPSQQAFLTGHHEGDL